MLGPLLQGVNFGAIAVSLLVIRCSANQGQNQWQ